MNLTTNRFHCVALAQVTPSRPRRSTFLTRHTTALAFTVGIGAWLAVAVPCRAGGLVISAPDITASAGSSGSFLVLLKDTNPGGGLSYNVAGDQFELALSGPAGINFTDATTATMPVPYIYAASTDNQLNLPLSNPPNPFPGTDFTALDTGYIEAGYPGYTTLNPGDVVALALVSYTVSPTAQAGIIDTIGFVGANIDTVLSDINGNIIPFAATDGSITISSVPEPSTWALGMIAIAIVGVTAFWSRRLG